MADTSLVYNILARDKASPVLARSAANVRAASLASAAGTAVMGAAFASAGAWAIALGAAVRPAVGAIALVPGVAFAAAAGIGALAFASAGLGEAWKQSTAATAGGGRSAASMAKQVAAAQREVKQATWSLADAQRAQLRTQQAITSAYAEAAERLEDLARSVVGARLDEQSAALSVVEAEAELAQVRRSGGTTTEIRRAELAYRQSVQTLAEVRDRVGDLTAENERAQAAGVEGSDEVREATERHAEATRNLEEAIDRLAAAQENLADAGSSAGGAADKAAEAMAKLSPNARELIRDLLGLRSTWASVRRQVSDATWANVGKDIKAVSTAYLPVARRELVALGAGWNTAIRASLGMFRSAEAVANVRTLIANTAAATGVFGQALSRVLAGLLNMGAAGSNFLPRMAQGALELAERFERWVGAARESGKLDQWISQGLATLKQLWSIAGNILTSFGAIFKAGQADGLLTDLDNATARLSAFLNSAEGQEKLSKVFSFLRDILGTVVQVIASINTESATMSATGSAASATFTVFGEIMKVLADHIGLITALLPILIPLWLAEKAGIGLTNIVAAIRLGIMYKHTIAMRANTAALAANTAATRGSAAAGAADNAVQNAGVLARIRSAAAAVWHRTVTIASSVATKAAAAAQWLLNAAMMANPIGLIIIAIIALVAGFILLYKKCDWFRAGVDKVFGWIIAGAKLWWSVFSAFWSMVGGWFVSLFKTWWSIFTGFWSAVFTGASAAYQWVVNKVGALVSFVTGLPGRLAAAGRGMWDWIGATFRSAINWVIARWNGLQFRIPPVSIPGIGQVWGGMALGTPDLPYLDTGGDIRSDGLAFVHAGERVMPAAQVSQLPSTPGGQRTVALDIRGGDREIVALIRRLIRTAQLLEA